MKKEIITKCVVRLSRYAIVPNAIEGDTYQGVSVSQAQIYREILTRLTGAPFKARLQVRGLIFSLGVGP